MYKNLLAIILIAHSAEWCRTYTVPPIDFELLDDDKFRISITSNDTDIKSVSFNVNINEEFEGMEFGDLTGQAVTPTHQQWSYEFNRKLNDRDIVYVALGLKVNNTLFYVLKDPISVKAVKSCTADCKSRSESSTELASTPAVDTFENKTCHPTISEVPKSFGGPYCRDDLIFSDDFDTINTQYWINEIYFPLIKGDSEFVLYNGTVEVEDGVLKIEAELNNKTSRYDTIDLGARCTSVHVKTECIIVPRSFIIMPGIISGRLSTRNYFSFKYGRVEVRAKMPIGDWLYPLISLRPNTSSDEKYYDSGELRVAFIHGNRDLEWQDKNINGGRLYGGAIVEQHSESRHKFMKDVTLPNVEHFGDDFHVYSLTWTPDELIMAVDGNEYGRISTNKLRRIREDRNVSLDKMFHITLGLAAGGHGDFPETDSKPWINSDPRGGLTFFRNRNIWHSTWVQPSLEVDFIRVYAI